ncbi:MAG: hypothetical protein Q8K79_19155 [Solirubrobacteraceae bacterium]|nr:hypothetical protein [Solirubrobacteraceae bacterium]
MTERHRTAVRFDEPVWRDAIRGFSGPPLQIAVSARARLERDGVTIGELRPCQTLGPDQTQLAGCAKLYLPITDEPASRRPLAFVLQLARDTHNDALVWVFIAFGHRHPAAGVRSVYERAHRQLHGHFPT